MYIHQYTCIAPQPTDGGLQAEPLTPSVEGKLHAIEPVLEGVPPGMVSRMSKAVRLGIGAGLPLLKTHEVDGIIIGTANGGMEDCIKFLNQIIDYDEGLLTPAHFVQSTPNAIAGQLSLITRNRTYNATHVHNGLAFENALLDARMLVQEHPGLSYLVGGIDEISAYNYNIDLLTGWYDQNKSNTTLYSDQTEATIAGEGAALFMVNDIRDGAIAKLKAIEIFESPDNDVVEKRFSAFLERNSADISHTLLISGENGDQRSLRAYATCEYAIGSSIPVVRYKHLTGDYPTASAFAVWLACEAIRTQFLPDHLYKNEHNVNQIDRIILYNQYQGNQHSFMLVSKADL